MNYVGLMNEITLELGLEMRKALHIANDSADFQVDVSIAGVHLKNALSKLTIPVLSLTADDFWQWASLSEIAAGINNTAHFTAELLSDDGPALTLVRQSNTLLVTAESISGKTVQLSKSTLVPGSESFSNPVPAYTLAADGMTLRFAAPVPDDTEITYRFRTCPCDLIASPVGDAEPERSGRAEGGAGFEWKDHLSGPRIPAEHGRQGPKLHLQFAP